MTLSSRLLHGYVGSRGGRVRDGATGAGTGRPPAHPRKGGEKLSGLMAPAGTAFTALNAGDNVPLQLVAVGAPAVILSATILAISLMVPGRRRRPSES